jgi:streptogramin lyase
MALGADGNVWFTENTNDTDRIGRVTATGVISEFDLPSGSYPNGIVAGPDGNMWFTDGERIGYINQSGTIREYTGPTALALYLAVGMDGNLWYTTSSGAIGMCTLSGTITELTLSSNPGLGGIARGSDNNLWFVENGVAAPKIGRITVAKAVSEFLIPTPYSNPQRITAGPDGNVWFTEIDKVGRITPNGEIAEFSVSTNDIATGPDGNIWVTIPGGGSPALGRITSSGTITMFPLPALAQAIAPGGDGNIWFSEPSAGSRARIGRFVLP